MSSPSDTKFTTRRESHLTKATYQFRKGKNTIEQQQRRKIKKKQEEQLLSKTSTPQLRRFLMPLATSLTVSRDDLMENYQRCHLARESFVKAPALTFTFPQTISPTNVVDFFSHSPLAMLQAPRLVCWNNI